MLPLKNYVTLPPQNCHKTVPEMFLRPFVNHVAWPPRTASCGHQRPVPHRYPGTILAWLSQDGVTYHQELLTWPLWVCPVTTLPPQDMLHGHPKAKSHHLSSSWKTGDWHSRFLWEADYPSKGEQRKTGNHWVDNQSNFVLLIVCVCVCMWERDVKSKDRERLSYLEIQEMYHPRLGWIMECAKVNHYYGGGKNEFAETDERGS